MQCSFLLHPYERLHEDSESPRVFLKDGFLDGFGGLSVNVKHVPRAVYARTPIGHCQLVQRISTLGIERREDRWSGDSGHGTTNARRRHLTGIRELAR